MRLEFYKKKGLREIACPLYHVRKQKEVFSSYPRRGSLLESGHAGTLILDLQPLEL